jgi:hypothetical protein
VYRVSIGLAGAITLIEKLRGGEIAALSVPRGRLGRAAPFCPVASHVDLLGDRQGVVDLDTEVAHRAFDLGMAQ